MDQLFANPSLQIEFEKNGFVKIPLLKQEEVQDLLAYYNNLELDSKQDNGFHISLDSQEPALVKEISNRIKTVFEHSINDVFEAAKVFTASYVIKEPGLQNIVPPHQDWTFVDEEKFCSLTVWTPLIDVTEENGALGVIRGSQHLFKHFRSSPSPQSKSPLSDHIFTLFPYVDIIEMKAGEALIFDNRLIHASPPNLSNSPRIAVGVGLCHADAKLLHYYQKPNSEPEQLEKYEVNEDFFYFYNNKRLAKLFDNGESPSDVKKIETIDREVSQFTKQEIEELLLQLKDIKYNQALMEKLAKLFNYTLDGKPKKNEIMEEKENKVETEKEKISVPHQEEVKSIDNRTFFQKYTPLNIYREIIWRLKGRP